MIFYLRQTIEQLFGMLLNEQGYYIEGNPLDGSPLSSVFIVFACVVAGYALFYYLFMSFGLYAMAKRRNMKIKYLAFIPFASTYLLGKLAGEISFFGLKIKRAGLIVMIAEILTAVCFAVRDFFYLPFFADLSKCYFNSATLEYYVGQINSMKLWFSLFSGGCEIIKWIVTVLRLFLLFYLFRNYAPQSCLAFTVLSVFFEFLAPVFVFAIRKNSCDEYRVFMRNKMRSMYGGGNPYDISGGEYSDPYDLSSGKKEPKESPFEEYDDKN